MDAKKPAAEKQPQSTVPPVEDTPDGAFKLPSKRAVEAAQKLRETKESQHEDYRPGRVMGLNYDEWATFIIPGDIKDPSRAAYERSRAARKGYVKLGGKPVVFGMEGAEVYVKPRAQMEKDREARRERIRDLQGEGIMSDQALLEHRISRSSTPGKKRRRAK